LVFPADSMNAISAKTLLKTLEEPPGECWFVLACAEAQHLLPTVRSRCQALALRTPERAEAVQWLRAQGVHGADVLLAASAGQPQVALRWAHSGLSAAQWLGLPAQVRRAEVGEMASWGFARALDAMSKLCHDSLCVAAGAEPRFFPSEVWGRGVGGQGGLPFAEVPVLLSWQRELQSQWRHADHPWAMPLAVEALVQSASQALR
jgi:DNA polymerase-3 subunit delta'